MMKHIKDERKLQQGFSCQERGRSAFDAFDFEEAFYLYTEAESFYREGFNEPGDRVFFMQCTAMRCLEVLLDNGRLDFYDTYQEKAKVFFEEWIDIEISAKITYRRRDEAFTFRLWRASHFRVNPETYDVNSALEHNDFERARKVLENLILRLEHNPFPESDALCAISRSKLEIITVKEQLKKREDQRDISVIASAYMRAAKASRLPEYSTSRQRQRIEAFNNWFLSHTLKFKAFARLKDEKMTNPISSLIEVEQLLAKAVEHAKRAISSPSGVDFPKSHFSYLRFWHAIISERLQLLKLMEKGKEEDFKLCIQLWMKALTVAEGFLKQGSEVAIFPNRFYSLRDLKLEEVFLKAAYAFRQQKWSDCATYLEEWRQEFPTEYRWSWRDIQVYIRFLFAKALCAFSEGNQKELREICKELEKVEKSEPIGNIGRFLVSEAKGLQMKKGIPLNDEYVNLLCACFSLDSYTDSYQTESEIDPFLSLPERVYDWLAQTCSPSTSVEVGEFREKVLGCVEALLYYICDYHLQILSPSELAPLPDLEALIERLSDLANIHWKERISLVISIESLKKAIEHLQKVEEPAQYKPVYEKIRGVFKELMRIAPVIIEIKSVIPSIEGLKGIEASPDWVLHRSRPGRERLFISASPEISLKPGMYYLPPKWRKGNRISYPVSEERSLLPVRYQPQWKFWEKAAANSSLVLIEGVSFAHLERAIELSGKCVGENKKPKVGSVIVKESKIVAEAFRGEDGSDKHAEEIAIGKCRKQDLNGATIITTLEPCIPPARSPNVASCAHLIIQNGIKKVIIGIIDPNREVHGGGDLLLRRNNISVAYFPSKLSREIWALNKEFIGIHTDHEFMPMYIYQDRFAHE